MKPLTYAETVRVFGNPEPYLLADGFGVNQEWESKTLAWAGLPRALPLAWDRSRLVKRFRCHAMLVEHFEAAFDAIAKDPRAWETINDFGGCYNFRANRSNAKALSMHSWGAAIDLDVCDNPRGREPLVHPVVVNAFNLQGFLWGGLFKGKQLDGMHFEFADVDRLTP